MFGVFDVRQLTLEQLYAAILLVMYCMPLDVRTRGQLAPASYRKYLQLGGQFLIDQNSHMEGLVRIMNRMIATHALFHNWEGLRDQRMSMPRYSAFHDRKYYRVMYSIT